MPGRCFVACLCTLSIACVVDRDFVYIYISRSIFIIMYGVYFIVHGARVHSLDYCAAQRLAGSWAILNDCARTCFASLR